jgi:hypothetical protein
MNICLYFPIALSIYLNEYDKQQIEQKLDHTTTYFVDFLKIAANFSTPTFRDNCDL